MIVTVEDTLAEMTPSSRTRPSSMMTAMMIVAVVIPSSRTRLSLTMTGMEAAMNITKPLCETIDTTTDTVGTNTETMALWMMLLDGLETRCASERALFLPSAC